VSVQHVCWIMCLPQVATEWTETVVLCCCCWHIQFQLGEPSCCQRHTHTALLIRVIIWSQRTDLGGRLYTFCGLWCSNMTTRLSVLCCSSRVSLVAILLLHNQHNL
jgi:hypothetical protein